jgi:hypothetical protein
MDVGVSIVNEVAAVVSAFIISTISHDRTAVLYRVHSSSRHRPFDRKNTSKIKFPDKVLLSRNYPLKDMRRHNVYQSDRYYKKFRKFMDVAQ